MLVHDYEAAADGCLPWLCLQPEPLCASGQFTPTRKSRAIRWSTGTLPPIGSPMASTATPWATHRASPPLSPRWCACPAIPAFLALCFALFGVANYHAVLYLQAIIDLGTCLLIAGLATKICGPRAGRMALLLAALCPFTANYVASPLTETLSIFCVALGFRAWRRCWKAPACCGQPC